MAPAASGTCILPPDSRRDALLGEQLLPGLHFQQTLHNGLQALNVRRTYVFAYGKQDKLLRHFYSEVYQPDGTIKKRTETFTNVQINPQLDERLFAFVPPPGSQPFKPTPFPPAPKVSSLPENAPEVPDSLRFRTNPEGLRL